MNRFRPLAQTVPAALLALAALSLAGAPPAAAQAARVADLKYPSLPPFEIPRPERTVLGNGMVVMLLEDHELPLVEVTAYVRTGRIFDPADKTGLSRIGAAVLRTGGTERMKPDELDEYLEDRAATIEANVFSDQGAVRMSCLAEDLPDLLRVYADVLRRPAFAEDRIEVARVAERDRVARQNDNPGSILFRKLREVVYGATSWPGTAPRSGPSR